MQNKINHPFAYPIARRNSRRPTLLFALLAMLTAGAS